eukprot:GGOE01049028.1.p4 GENE.GGOE01049028.1~~GGOE01049028.1.p4  ORF type:complete len:118 (-),score=49.63 GGOE01049028.1:113-466(-)
MLAAVHRPQTTLLAGDFNMAADSMAMGLAEAKGMRRLFANDDFEGSTTFNLQLLHNVQQRIPHFVPKVIDMVLAGDGFTLLARAAPQHPTLSDHVPLCVTLRLEAGSLALPNPSDCE